MFAGSLFKVVRTFIADFLYWIGDRDLDHLVWIYLPIRQYFEESSWETR